MVEVDFIVVNAYSPYAAIVVRPWLHALGAISSTLHQKVKYPSGGQIEEIVRSQSSVRQCRWLPYYISPKLSSRPLLKGAYSN